MPGTEAKFNSTHLSLAGPPDLPVGGGWDKDGAWGSSTTEQRSTRTQPLCQGLVVLTDVPGGDPQGLDGQRLLPRLWDAVQDPALGREGRGCSSRLFLCFSKLF